MEVIWSELANNVGIATMTKKISPLDGNASDWVNKLSARDKRSLIFHLLYAAEEYDYSITSEDLIEEFNKGFNLHIPLNSSIHETVKDVIAYKKTLDEIYKPYLANWRIERIGVCTKLILRYATWELLHTDTDRSIIINEAVELAKCFAEKDSYKFINGILDEIAKNTVTKKIDSDSKD